MPILSLARLFRGPAILVLFCAFSPVFSNAQTPTFGSGTIVGTVSASQITEASGIVASRQNPGVLWTHNDSSYPGTIFALWTNGILLGSCALSGAFSGDYEDIALGPGPVPNLQYVYLGDIGDNSSARSQIRVFRIPEPAFYSYQSNAPLSLSAVGAREIVLTYPDGPHNAEALIIDPWNGDLFIATKFTNSSNIYQATRAQLESDEPVQLMQVQSVGIKSVSAGDISPDGKLIALRRASRGELWVRQPGQTLRDAMDTSSIRIPVIGQPTEPNGEALGFHPSGLGYYTLSEGLHQPIYFFARTDSGVPPQPRVFIEPGESWRYYDSGADLGTAWRAADFDDSDWSEGPAQLGYGQGDEQTAIGYGDPIGKLTTTYFRKTVDVASVNGLTNLALRVCFNDGIAVYLNGAEVWRHNLVADAAFDTLANVDRGQWQNVWWSIPLDPVFLDQGQNTFAVELHRFASDGADLSFDLQLIEAQVDSPAHFTAPPQITNGLCRLFLAGPVGSLVKIEASEDLQNWSAVGEAALDDAGAGIFEDGFGDARSRFYRVAEPFANL